MKNITKRISLLFIALMCLTAFFNAYANTPNKIVINAVTAEIPADMGSIKEASGRTFVPVRFLLEYFNYSVTWDEQDKIVFGRNSVGDVFVMQEGSPYLTVRQRGGKAQNIVMDAVPFLSPEEGRTYVPVRFLAQAIGYTVGYDDASGTVVLKK